MSNHICATCTAIVTLMCATAAVARRPSNEQWHLIRITQRERLSGAQRAFGAFRLLFPPASGAPVIIYVVDSGVRVTHSEFGGRADTGPDFVTGALRGDGRDCQGHGTSVGALAAGLHMGVARGARVISVRVLDCAGAGYCADVLRALEWVAQHANASASSAAPARSVAVLSLGSSDVKCGAASRHMAALAARGVVVVAAAGNMRADACRYFPARGPGAIAVGATDVHDRLFRDNNRGTCVDVLAPGVRVVSAWGNTTDNAYRAASGTSMAAPLVAGAAALALAADPTLDSAQVRAIILGGATVGMVKSRDGKRLGGGIANKILLAPWARLFEEICRDVVPRMRRWRGSERSKRRMNLLEVDLQPRVRPAMLYSAHAIRDAVAKIAALPNKNVLVRRAPNVQVFKNGSEPGVIRLRVYFYQRNKSGDVKRIDRGVRCGAIERIVREKLRFHQMGGGSFVKENVELPDAVFDRARRPLFIDLDATSIVLIAISCWMFCMLTIAIGTSIWKKKMINASRRDNGRGAKKRSRKSSLSPPKNVSTENAFEIQKPREGNAISKPVKETNYQEFSDMVVAVKATNP